MDLKPSEVATVLKSEIEGFAGRMQKSSVGTVLMVGDGVARVHGLDDCMMNEMLDFRTVATSEGLRSMVCRAGNDSLECGWDDRRAGQTDACASFWASCPSWLCREPS